MRIVHYLARMRLTDGGVVRAVLDLCGALAERGHDVTVATFDGRDAPREWTGEPGRPRVLVLNRGAAEAHSAIAGADAVHLHVPWDPVCLRLARMARRAGVPYVVGIHGMLDDWCMEQKRLKKRLYLAIAGRRMLERAAAVHVTAEAEGVQSSKWYPRGRPVVLPLIFDLAQYEDLPGPGLARQAFGSAFSGNGRPVLLFLSRLHPKKRVELLIEAAAALRNEGLDVRAIIAGTGEPAYERSLRELADSLGVAGRVGFVGFVSGREKLSLYETADVFVLPTSQENWGFVLLESLACGTPVITTRGVDIWSELLGSGAAIIVEQTAAAVAAAVAGLLRDRPRHEAMRRKARAWALRNLAPEAVIARYEELYAGLRGPGRPHNLQGARTADPGSSGERTGR